MKQFSDSDHENIDLGQEQLDRALLRLQKIVVGNGVKKTDVTIKASSIANYTIQASLTLQTAARIREEKLPGRRPVGETVDKGQAASAAQKYAENMGQNEQFQNTVRQILQKRPAQGFGLSREAIIVETAQMSISEVDTCRPCQGEGQTPCSPCQARGQASCEKCRGMRESQCYVCKGQGFTPGVNGQETQCYACHGRRVLQCDMCRGMGQVTCRVCQGTGRMSCVHCQGNGASTYVVHVNVDAMPEFVIDQSTLPTEMYNMMMSRDVQKLAAQGHFDVSMGRDADDEPQAQSFYAQKSNQGWKEQYKAECLWGKISFTVGKTDVSGHIFGRKGMLVNMPEILDDLLVDMIKRLNGAAKGKLSPTAALERACRRRIIREALPILLAKGRHKCLTALGKAYPFGLSAEAAKAMISSLAGVITRMTRFPAWSACALGCLSLSLLLWLWFFAGIRIVSVGSLPIEAGFVADLGVSILLGYCAILAIRMTEHHILKMFFRRLKLPMKLLSRLPRAGGVELVSIGLSIVTCLGWFYLAGETHAPWIGLIGE